MKKIFTGKMILIWSILIAAISPLIGSLIRNNGKLPPGFGVFPPQKVLPDPGFNILYFILVVSACLFILAFLIFPSFFGFKPPYEKERSEKVHNGKFPIWFWVGSLIAVISLILMWGKFQGLREAATYSFVPLWWGFIVAIDGLVYKRTGGKSIISKRPKTMIVLIVFSVVGWFFLEYLNYFVNENWVYPNNKILSQTGNILWFTISYTTVWPTIFEWYTLINSSDFFKRRYSNGPKLPIGKKVGIFMLVLGTIVSFLTGLFCYLFFWGIWIGPLLVFSGALLVGGFWSFYKPLSEKGNWNPLIFIALASIFNGFFWELWNYGSMHINPNIIVNPNYWQYEIPYVAFPKIFSEMPLFGYFGYMPFGVLCWLMWLIGANLLNYNPDFDPNTDN